MRYNIYDVHAYASKQEEITWILYENFNVQMLRSLSILNLKAKEAQKESYNLDIPTVCINCNAKTPPKYQNIISKQYVNPLRLIKVTQDSGLPFAHDSSVVVAPSSSLRSPKCSASPRTSHTPKTLYAISYLEIQMKYPNGVRVRWR